MAPLSQERAASPFAEAEDPPQVERARINYLWILRLRWAAAGGQLLTVLMAAWVFHVPLPLAPILAVISLEVGSNLVLEWWLRRQLSRGRWSARHNQALELLFGVMCVDVLLLTALLYSTGGPKNPFSIFYLVHLVLAGVVLRPQRAWVVDGLALAGFLFVFIWHRDLPAVDTWSDSHAEASAREASTGLYLRGVLTAFCGAGLILAYFVTRVTHTLRVREAELLSIRQRRARSERLEALATLAAGAAHELASPLSTIGLVAKELERELEGFEEDSDVKLDLALIRSEVERCRGILDQMSVDTGQARTDRLERLVLRELVESAREDLNGAERITFTPEEGLGELELFVPRRTLALALRGVLKNALDASPAGAPVTLRAETRAGTLALEVTDRGEGMSAQVIERAFDPFFTTKGPGEGMGLGLFLSHTVVDRLGGRIEFDSQPGLGTVVTLVLPLRDITPPEQAADPIP